MSGWDFRDERNYSQHDHKNRYKLVESVHFTPVVEALIRGETTVSPYGDIIYTLGRFPNHPRALWAASRWLRQNNNDERELKKGIASREWPKTADCVFDRAMRFAPDDAVVRMIWGIHLHLVKRFDEALESYRVAEELGLESAEFHYNRGLLLLDMGDIVGAKADAEVAYAKGHPLSALRNRISELEATN